MLYKKGLSAVIATVLLVLLTIAAGGIIANFVVPFVKDSLSGTECVKFRDYFKFEEDFEYNCYDDNGLHGVSIKVVDNSDADKVKGFDLIFKKEDSAKKVSVRNGNIESCSAGEISILGGTCLDVIEIPGAGSYYVVTYIYNSSGGDYKKAEIYAVIENDDVCELSDSIKLIPCGPGINLTG